MKKYLRLMRVKHYVKNLLLLLPAFLTQRLSEGQVIYELMTGIIIFSLTSSVIYLVNDLKDAEADSRHPIKCRRPLASGEISVRMAKYLAAALTAAVIIVWRASNLGHPIKYLLIPFLYLAVNVAYSMKLKEYQLIDVFILMIGYVLRLAYGGMIIGTGVSAWMFLTVTAGAFFLGFGKRRNELLIYGDKGRANLKGYSLAFLDQACLMSMTTTIVFYALSCVDVNTAVADAGISLLWSVPLVFMACLRYLMILNNGKSDGDPVEVLLGDKWLLVLGVVYLAVLTALLYGM